jgi:quercetin dioxygenase-like cupin family protein
MKITHLYTGADNKSHFEDINHENDIVKELGAYTKKMPASGIMFRETHLGNVFEMHNALQPQYIIYLEGEIEVTTSSGETRVF